MIQKLSFLAVALALTTATNTASASQPFLPLEESKLTEFRVDPALGIPGSLSGRITHDLSERTLKLSLTQAVPCTPDERNICLAVMPFHYEVTLDVVREYTNECGSRVIVASVDRTPVDGEMQTLTLMDHRKMTCRMFVPPTTVTYETLIHSRGQGRTIETTSHFAGESLKPIIN